MARRWMGAAVGVGAAVLATVAGGNCTGTEAPEPDLEQPEPEPAAPAAPAPTAAPEGPLPAIIMVQAQFVKGPDRRPRPGPARMTLFRTDGQKWYPEVIEDPESNVFHKGIPWRDGILTLGAMKAKLKHWKDDAGEWKATTLWEQSWGGRFDRLRDLEVGDVDGDGKEELVIATHDMGVVAVGDENEDGTWSFAEFDKKADTFVHEVEIGDVDADGKPEFYVTPSARNRSSGASQPGGVVRYDFRGEGKYERTSVVEWNESHAKEILVADVDGDGKHELYAAKEGHVEKAKGGPSTLVEPVKIVRLTPADGKWTETVVATLDNERQCRFLVPGDVDGDGKVDIVAAGMETGLWKLDRKPDGTFAPVQIEADAGGFEHATHVADLDKDGKLEIYAASEKSGARELRRYTWNGTAWQKTVIAEIPEDRITWFLSDATL